MARAEKDLLPKRESGREGKRKRKGERYIEREENTIQYYPTASLMLLVPLIVITTQHHNVTRYPVILMHTIC
jgi:hypothetical protein